jgi:hypothetical protein
LLPLGPRRWWICGRNLIQKESVSLYLARRIAPDNQTISYCTRYFDSAGRERRRLCRILAVDSRIRGIGEGEVCALQAHEHSDARVGQQESRSRECKPQRKLDQTGVPINPKFILFSNISYLFPLPRMR